MIEVPPYAHEKNDRELLKNGPMLIFHLRQSVLNVLACLLVLVMFSVDVWGQAPPPRYLECEYLPNCTFNMRTGVLCAVPSVVACVGDRRVNLTHYCRFCHQLPEKDIFCTESPATDSFLPQRYLALCVADDSVPCMGERVFLKYRKSAWVRGKKWSTTIELSLFLGGFGADRFYLGYWALGVVKFVTGGGLGIWTVLDFILEFAGFLGPADGSIYVDKYTGWQWTRSK